MMVQHALLKQTVRQDHVSIVALQKFAKALQPYVEVEDRKNVQEFLVSMKIGGFVQMTMLPVAGKRASAYQRNALERNVALSSLEQSTTSLRQQRGGLEVENRGLVNANTT